MRIRFYGELNRYLPIDYRGIDREIGSRVQSTVQELIEEANVPPCEVDLILVNGKPIGFDHEPAPSDRISVYPRFRTLDISPLHLINRGWTV